MLRQMLLRLIKWASEFKGLGARSQAATFHHSTIDCNQRGTEMTKCWTKHVVRRAWNLTVYGQRSSGHAAADRGLPCVFGGQDARLQSIFQSLLVLLLLAQRVEHAHGLLLQFNVLVLRDCTRIVGGANALTHEHVLLSLEEIWRHTSLHLAVWIFLDIQIIWDAVLEDAVLFVHIRCQRPFLHPRKLFIASMEAQVELCRMGLQRGPLICVIWKFGLSVSELLHWLFCGK